MGHFEDLIDPSKNGGKRFREWGDEASWIKHIGYEQPPIAKPSQATEPQKDDEKGIAEKGWQILNSRIQDKLRYHFKDMYPSKDWDNFDINSPEHNDIMNDIVTDDRAAKDIKDILNETGRIDGKHVPEYDKFMSAGFGIKFFECIDCYILRILLYDAFLLYTHLYHMTNFLFEVDWVAWWFFNIRCGDVSFINLFGQPLICSKMT